MNSSSGSTKEPSPAPTKELSPTVKDTPKREDLKLKRSSPVLTKKLTSPFLHAKKVDHVTKSDSLPLSNIQVKENKEQEISSNSEMVRIPASSDDELLNGEMKLNRKRSTLTKRLSTSADNVLDIQNDVSPSTNSLTSSKKKASRSKSSDNLSVIHGRGTSIRRSGRRKNQVGIDSPKSPPPHDSNKLISLAQGILNNLRIPGFSRQPSGSEPPLRSSWCLKMYDGTNDLENYVANRDRSCAEAEETSKNQQMANNGEKSEESGKQRHRNSRFCITVCKITVKYGLQVSEHFFTGSSCYFKHFCVKECVVMNIYLYEVTSFDVA